jgi:hypothetical protein
MALVNPNIAMSFRQPEFRPRNALAEYAQVQSIMGGQRQAEMADMQIAKMRRDEQAIDTMMQAIAKADGPTDPLAASKAMIASRVPEYVKLGLQMQQTTQETERIRALMGLPPRYSTGAAPSASAAAAAPAGAAPAFPIAGKDVPMGALGTGTFDSARVGDIGLAQPGLTRMSAAEKAELAASAGPGGIQSMGLPQGAYAGTEPMIADILRAPPEVQAAIDRALPSMKIPGVSAGRVPPFSQLSRDLLSPETRNALDLNYAPAATNALTPASAAATAPPANVNQLAAAGTAPKSLQERQALEMLLSSNEAVRRRGEEILKQMNPAPSAIAVLENEIGRFVQAGAKPDDPRIVARQNKIAQLGGAGAPLDISRAMAERDRLIKSGLPASHPDVQALNNYIRKQSTHAPATTVNVTQEKAERGKFGELLVEQYKNISGAAQLAAKTLPSLDAQSKILDQGFTTGFGTDVKAAAASVLAALGVPEAEKFATDAQTFLASTQQAVLQKQLEQKGPQTEPDAQRITQTAAQRGNTVGANRFLIDVAREQLKRDIEQRDFYSQWRRGPGKNSFDGAEEAWYEGAGGKSLFDRPALKKYLAPAQNAAPAVPQAAINDLRAGRGTDAQFDAIFGAGAAKRAREGK